MLSALDLLPPPHSSLRTAHFLFDFAPRLLYSAFAPTHLPRPRRTPRHAPPPLRAGRAARLDRLRPGAVQRPAAPRPPSPPTRRATPRRQLAAHVRKWYGNGPGPKVEELDVTWMIASEMPLNSVKVVSEDGQFTLPLERIGETDVYVGSMTFPEGRGDGLARRVRRQAPPPPASARTAARKARHNWRSTRPTPTACRRPGVPTGKLTQMPSGRARSSTAPRATGGSTSPPSTRPRSPRA